MSGEARYPEHAKLRAIRHESQAQGEFLEWLQTRGIAFCSREGRGWFPIRETTQALLARYHEIDLDRLEREKRAMLDELRTRPPLARPEPEGEGS